MVRGLRLIPATALSVDQNGQLGDGVWVSGAAGITIPANALSINTIGRDGVVSVTQQGQAAPVQVGQLNLTLTFMNDTGLESTGENLYIDRTVRRAERKARRGSTAGLLYQGYVETSNVTGGRAGEHDSGSTRL